MEDTYAGRFLKGLDINYASSLSYTGKIRQALEKSLLLEEVYIEGKNKVLVRRWIILTDGETSILNEKIARGEEYDTTWFEYPLPAGGVPYYELIGERALELKPMRKYEHSVTISSRTDNARLLLFGFGSYCTSITVLGGAYK